MDELRFDGNAAAGTSEEIFYFEEIMAEYACGGCVRAGTLREEESGLRTPTEANDEP